MIKQDKNKFCINIVRHSNLDAFYRHFDSKEGAGLDKAMKEAQRLANETGKKVVIMQSIANVYPDKVLTQDQKTFLTLVNEIEKEVVNG
jgi:predicted metalloendopeptidase